MITHGRPRVNWLWYQNNHLFLLTQFSATVFDFEENQIVARHLRIVPFWQNLTKSESALVSLAVHQIQQRISSIYLSIYTIFFNQSTTTADKLDLFWLVNKFNSKFETRFRIWWACMQLNWTQKSLKIT